MSPIFDQLAALLNTGGPRETILAGALAAVLVDFHSETGTLHRLDEKNQLLKLVAQQGLPPQLLDVVGTIPVGKGIAGQVAAQNRPVTLCNLQTDTSGVAKPGARQTGVGGALCVPVRLEGRLVGTLGVGTRREYEYTPEETARLEEAGRLLAPLCAG
jgi:L-methionine (R)-S-oxide reductase